jgi:hypothetical protein
MLTLFTLPKGFTGHFGLIQRNAILSWQQLRPCPEILLLGDDPGVADFAAEHGLQHISGVQQSPMGLPLISDIFAQAEKHATNSVLCYINADIILLSDFTLAINQVMRRFRKYLIAGRRTEVDIAFSVDFNDPAWESRLRELAREKGFLQVPGAIDYFVFNRGLFGRIPPFMIGRFVWDNWLMYRAREQGAAVVDASEVVLAVHQNHDYSYASAVTSSSQKQREIEYNRSLTGGDDHIFTLYDATYKLTSSGLRWATDRWRAYLSRVPVFYPHLAGPTRLALQALESASRLWQRWRCRGPVPLGEPSS